MLTTVLICPEASFHGDDNGLVLPPLVAPIQVVIVPIQMAKEGVIAKCKEVKKALDDLGLRVKLDDSDHTPGWKFANYEVKGVPLRIEIGPKDIENGHVLVLCPQLISLSFINLPKCIGFLFIIL